MFETVQDYLAFLKRRMSVFVIPAACIFVFSLALALGLPSKYQSSATLLLEEPDLPRELMPSTVSSYAARRIQVIKRRIMTQENLLKLNEKYDIVEDYNPDKRYLASEIALFVSQNIDLNVESAEFIDPTSGRPAQATIGFKISFRHADPEVAQKVVNELVSLFLRADSSTLRKKAAETTAFFVSESEKLQAQIGKLEKRIARFKDENSGSLPEDIPVNRQAVHNIDRALPGLTEQIQAQKEIRVHLESQLAQISPHASISLRAETVLRPEDKLKKLEAEYSELLFTYGRKHPRMIELSSEIDTLREITGRNGNEKSGENPSNPAYIQLQTELLAVNSRIASLQAEKAKLTAQRDNLQNLIFKAPEIEREFLERTREYEEAVNKYHEVKASQMRAELGESFEGESEELTLLEPAQLPLKPISANRTLIVALGFVFSIGSGFGIAVAAEAIDGSIHGPRDFGRIAGSRPTVIVPYMKTSSAELRKWVLWFIAVIAMIPFTMGGIYLFNEFVVQLDFSQILGRYSESTLSSTHRCCEIS